MPEKDEVVESAVENNDTGEVERKDDAVVVVDAETSEKTPELIPATLPRKHRLSILFIVLASALVLTGILFWVFKDQIIGLFVKQPSASVTNTTATNEQSAVEQSKVTDPELVKFITPTTGETWLVTPKDMAPQGWLVVEQPSYYKDTGVGTSYYKSAKQQLAEATPTYKEVGSRDGNTIVLVHSPYEGMDGMDYVFEKRADGKVATIIQPQAAGYVDKNSLSYAKSTVTSLVTIFDETTHYDSLNVPAKILLGSGEYVQRPANLWLSDSLGVASGSGTTATLIEKLGASALYRTEVKYADTGLTNIGYYMQLPIGTKVGLSYAPNQVSLEGYAFDNGVNLQYKNGNGDTVYDELTAIARGCGGNSAAVTRSDTLKDADLIQVGKSNTGRAVYELKDKTAALYTKAYDEYKQTYDKQAVSFDDYVKNHGLVIMKDAKGELLVYVRSKYAAMGGCAKPVVYLYPTQPTPVDVKVGATVTVSDPLYTANGWKNVLAQPNGQLTYQGKAYDSLFWEGQGVGSYPGIVSGTVVKRADAASTIRQQVAEQGLNVKETNDFMAFWESKIPNKPYIRLTWLSTAEMNTLAPLRVTPKPDTVIRVFLDMDGYDTPILLPAQKLTAVPRNGFTVVEWGGLTSIIE